jgi:hypothetical protein
MTRASVLLLLVVPALVACGPPPETAALDCDPPQLTDLGHVTREAPARFTTTGGRVRFAVDDPDDGTISIEVDRTTITVVGESVHVEVEVDSEHPGSVDVPAGTYSVSVAFRDVTMATCPDTVISDVVPGIGTVHTSTPSPTTS